MAATNKRKNPNPTNSSVVQALLDARQALLAAGENPAEIDAALAIMQKKNAVLQAADHLFNGHRYPEKALVYSKTSRFGECRAVHTLSPIARSVLLLMESVVSQDGLVSLPLKTIMVAAGISLNPARKALAELEESGFIAVYKPAVQRQAAVYMLNPAAVTCGTSTGLQDEFQELAGNSVLRWQQLQQRNKEFEVAYITLPPEDNRRYTVKIGTLMVSKKKSPALDPADDFK